jgi:peptidoglycan LD-endopeptidase LytH
MKNNGYQRKQAGWAVTVCMFLAGFIVGAAAVTSYFWATGQLKRTIYLGVSPPAATKPVPHPAAPRALPPAPAPHPPAPAQPVAPAAPVSPSAPAPSASPAPAAPATVAGAQSADVQYLAQRHLLIPVAGVKQQALHDNFNDSRGGRRHEAIDIMAPAGTPVLACDDGHIAKLFTSQRGGLTIYEYDPSRTYTYYYAHLSRYAAGLQEQAAVKRGQVIGYVGSSGDANAAAPHLHFAINRLPANKDWWQGAPIDPYPFLANRPVGH